jgi:tRNA A58 N-methylase Trm61
MQLFRALALLLTGFPAFCQQLAPESLAPFIPSPQVLVDKMLELAAVKPDEMVYDLGAGDGRIVITAAQKFRARAVGIELHAGLYRTASERVKGLGLEERVKIIHGNFLKVDLSPADVVTMYLLTNSNVIVKPNLEKYLKPGARVVSLDFEVRGWEPVVTSLVNVGGMKHKIFLYERPKEKAGGK